MFKNGKKTAYYYKYVDEIRSNNKLSVDEREALIDELDSELSLNKSARKNRYTLSTFESHMKNSSIERFIYNMGVDPQSMALQTHATKEDIYNEGNWDFKNNRFSFRKNGELYMFEIEFDYYESRGVNFRRI